MMSISFGGLGLMSLRRPFSEVVGIVLGKGDIQSIFCLVVFCIVFFVLGNFFFAPLSYALLTYSFKLTLRIHPKTLSEHISQSFLSANILVASTITSTTTLLFRKRLPVICLFAPVPPTSATLCLSTIARLSILPIVLRFLYGHPNMCFIVLGYLQLLQSYLSPKQIVHSKISGTVLLLILGSSALLENGGEAVCSKLGIRTLLPALAMKKAGAREYSA